MIARYIVRSSTPPPSLSPLSADDGYLLPDPCGLVVRPDRAVEADSVGPGAAGPVGVVEFGVYAPEVDQGLGMAVVVTDLPEDVPGLLVGGDRLVEPPHLGQGEPEVAPCCGGGAAVEGVRRH